MFDSLATAGMAPKPVLENIKKHIEDGTIGELFQRAAGGGGGGGGGGGMRPAESPLPRAGGRGGRGGAADSTKKMGADTTKKMGADTTKAAGPEGGAEEGAVSQEVLSDVLAAVRASKALPRGGLFGGGRGAGFVETGDYLVTMTAGGITQKQVVRVEKAADLGGNSAQDDEDFDP